MRDGSCWAENCSAAASTSGPTSLGDSVLNACASTRCEYARICFRTWVAIGFRGVRVAATAVETVVELDVAAVAASGPPPDGSPPAGLVVFPRGSDVLWKYDEADEPSEVGVLSSPVWRQKPSTEERGCLCFLPISIRMIRFILLQNRQGKTRLAKYYVALEDSEKHKVEYEVHRLVVNRDSKFTNFVEVGARCDNELAYLECIHLFVEILDHFFSNVCELDLVDLSSVSLGTTRAKNPFTTCCSMSGFILPGFTAGDCNLAPLEPVA
ncbi:hypothetical protein Taro_008808 [Colocasia esculenta]|uniref:AP complex mu/sigma subunit domain-containing protein n=1 Tax=Colocasia esculenta TaxID=4460 RepID=A0A843U426_COLES|nr:hypothetical protein [Colocasia esculenta]